MNQEEIIKQNKLIAEFMGEKIDLSKWGENWKRIINQYTTNEVPNYHSDWGWLMPVVEKIEQNHFVDIPTLLFGNYSCKIMKLDRKEFPKYEGWEAGDNQIYTNSTSKIEAVYEAVVEFIKTKK